MAWFHGGVACPKPTKTRKQLKDRRHRAESATTKAVRLAVFDREQSTCRCCKVRLAESLHEIKPRSLGGKRTLSNCVALCGSGTTGCHGFVQSYRIVTIGRDAEQALTFIPQTPDAKDWMAGR